jgi:hypothetical protein
MNETTPLRISHDGDGVKSSSTFPIAAPSSSSSKPIISSPLVRDTSLPVSYSSIPTAFIPHQSSNDGSHKNNSNGETSVGGLVQTLQSLSPKLTKALSGSEEEIASTFSSPAKAIGALGSLAIIANNTTGPGMMALPQQFQLAGIIPSALCIIFVCVGASLATTLMADTIASIPGNAEFSRPIDFPTAFRMIVGKS